jgi:hypothetical protein
VIRATTSAPRIDQPDRTLADGGFTATATSWDDFEEIPDPSMVFCSHRSDGVSIGMEIGRKLEPVNRVGVRMRGADRPVVAVPDRNRQSGKIPFQAWSRFAGPGRQ